MNMLPSIPRSCARQTASLLRRPTILSQPSPSSQLRHLATSIQAQAQPIQLSSATLPGSPSESSTLASSVLSRATTDSESHSQPSKSKSKPSTRSDSKPPTTRFATVTRTGTMLGAVQLTARTQIFNKDFQKYYTRPQRFLAHDPNPAGFLRVGDVVQYSPMNETELAVRDAKREGIKEKLVRDGKISFVTRRGKVRSSKEVGLNFGGPEVVVRKVITPFGVALEERVKG